MRNILKGLVILSRIIVGGLFIISGLIKMNDAYGFSYKLDEYFGEKVFNMPFLLEYTLELSIFICIAEVLLGVAVLIWAKQKLTSVLLLVMIAFFTWLTSYTANCDPHEIVTIELGGEMIETTKECVLSCGCFGNAIPLTPTESFHKDLFLGVWIIILLIYAFFLERKEDFDQSIEINRKLYWGTLALALVGVYWFSASWLEWLFPVSFTAICIIIAEVIRRRVSGNQRDWIVAGAIAVFCMLFSYCTVNYLPIKDYRGFSEGSNIIHNMKSAEELGLEPPKYVNEYTLTNLHTKQDTLVMSDWWLKEYSTDWFKRNYEVKTYEGREIKVSDGYEPPIADFTVEDLYGDIKTDEILAYEGYTLVIVSKDMDKLMEKDISDLKKLTSEMTSNGHKALALVSGSKATKAGITEYKEDSGFDIPFYMVDNIALKTIIRSNPGFVLLKDATVMRKWSWKGRPVYSDIEFN